MAKPVTMQRLTDWVAKNRHRTWNFKGGYGDEDLRLTLEIKYIDFVLDTRDMKVFHLGIRGCGEKFDCDFRDDFQGDILELLEKRLEERKDAE